MIEPTNRRWLLAALVVAGWASCGGAGTEGVLDPTGGEVCLPDRRVCISVPIGAVDATRTVRISPSNDARPAAALSEMYDISAVGVGPDGGTRLLFSKPAKVTFALSIVDAGEVPSENLLRIYTIDYTINEAGEWIAGDWVSLANPRIDRVQEVVVGEVSHLTPFVVMRADRLPDGGLPVQIDSGVRDAGVIVVPFDSGVSHLDAGTPDAGHVVRDGGHPHDAGVVDAGPPPFDAGTPDAGRPDAGPFDAGVPDSDSGVPDAGVPDSPDAGPFDAGQPEVDAGTPVIDAGTDDAGVGPGLMRPWELIRWP